MTKSMLFVVLLTAGAILPAMGQSISSERVRWWREHAPTCMAPDGFVFPSKRNAEGCDDGDMTLFAGLLCAAGDSDGCETVKRSQDASGRWFRSPRRAQTANLGNPNSFSPDMALGAQLYGVSKGDADSIGRWLKWMDRVRPCWIGSGDDCFRGPLLRFCTDDTEKGCTVRPGDAATLNATVRSMGVALPTEDMDRMFDQAGKNLMDQLWVSAQVNKPGYSQHLVAVQIFLLRKAGLSDARLDTAAVTLSEKQPGNPFFAYLREGRTERVRELALAACPSPEKGLPTEMDQWSWEREDAEQAWRSSMLWDCLFIAKLLEATP